MVCAVSFCPHTVLVWNGVMHFLCLKRLDWKRGLLMFLDGAFLTWVGSFRVIIHLVIFSAGYLYFINSKNVSHTSIFLDYTLCTLDSLPPCNVETKRSHLYQVNHFTFFALLCFRKIICFSRSPYIHVFLRLKSAWKLENENSLWSFFCCCINGLDFATVLFWTIIILFGF